MSIFVYPSSECLQTLEHVSVRVSRNAMLIYVDFRPHLRAETLAGRHVRSTYATRPVIASVIVSRVNVRANVVIIVIIISYVRLEKININNTCINTCIIVWANSICVHGGQRKVNTPTGLFV